MRVLETHIDIDAGAEAVWAVLTDFAAFGEWNPFITSIDGPTTPGSRLEVTIHPPDGKPITLRPTVEVSEPNRRFAWLGHLGVRGVFDGAHEFILESNGHGGTSFTQRETFRGVLVPLVGSVLRKTQRGFDAMNVALKARAEVRQANVSAR